MSLTQYYATRGFLIVNGVQQQNIANIEFTVDEAISVVDTMTSNNRSAGYRKGNRKVSGSFELEIQDAAPSVDLSFQYGNDVAAIVQVGTSGDRYQLIGLVQGNQAVNTSVGTANKKIAFTAIDAVNENGPSVNSQWGF